MEGFSFNCPNCGAPYNKQTAGLCECCGREFTEDDIRSEEKKRIIKDKERERIIKLETEQRKKEELKREKERLRQEALKREEEEQREEQRRREEQRLRQEIRRCEEERQRRAEAERQEAQRRREEERRYEEERRRQSEYDKRQETQRQYEEEVRPQSPKVAVTHRCRRSASRSAANILYYILGSAIGFFGMIFPIVPIIAFFMLRKRNRSMANGVAAGFLFFLLLVFIYVAFLAKGT